MHGAGVNPVGDSVESRLARLEQRTDDLSLDVRAFTPLVQDQAVLRSEMQRAHVDLNNLAQALRDLVKRMDEEAKDRARDQADREQRERRERFLRMTTLVMLVFVFVSTTAAVLALVVS